MYLVSFVFVICLFVEENILELNSEIYVGMYENEICCVGRGGMG